MNVLVFGGGSRLAKRLGVNAIWKPWLVSRMEADVRLMPDITYFVEKHKPDVVVNCAAVTDVNACERNPEHAISVNALGAANIAMVCRMKDVPLVHISTDYVFSGNNGPKAVGDETYPVNAYGLTKLLGESAVLSIMPTEAIVLRVGWLYGVEYPQSQPMIAAIQSDPKSPAYIFDNIRGNPTFVGHAATMVNMAIYHAEKDGRHGLHSLLVQAGPDAMPLTWYEFLRDTFNIVQMKEGKYRGVDVQRGTGSWGGTWRPTNGGMVPSEGWATPDYRTGLADFIKEYLEAFPQKAGAGT